MTAVDLSEVAQGPQDVAKQGVEQGQWSAKAALEILRGNKPSEISIATNSNWDMWVNETLVSAAGLELPRAMIAKAERLK